jgi:hypothetical protein
MWGFIRSAVPLVGVRVLAGHQGDVAVVGEAHTLVDHGRSDSALM